VFQDVRRLDERGRICLPPEAVNGEVVLAILDAPGRVRLLPWKDQGEAIAKRRNEMRSIEPRTVVILEALRQIEDRYQLVSLEKPPRFTPSPNMSLHLGLGVDKFYYLWRYPDWLELWSPAYRNARLPEVAVELEGLP
jgi:hypothetical protein